MIGANRVTAPDGTVWRVGRRWLPDKPVLWRRKRRDGDRGGDWLTNLGAEGAADAVGIALLVVAIVLVFILLTTVVFPIIVLTVELLLVAVLLVGGIAARLVFRRPWTIRARAADGRELTWHATGFRRSGRVRDDAAAALTLGHIDVQPSEAGV